MSAVDFDEVKQHLNISGDTNDVELFGVLAAAEAVVSNRVGPLEVQDSATATVTGGSMLVLPVAPVATATLADGDAAVDANSFEVDGTAGLIRFTDGRCVPSTYTVTYAPGREFLPDDLVFAIKEMVRHLWKSQRAGASAKPGSSAESVAAPGYLIPYAVAELLEPHVQHRIS